MVQAAVAIIFWCVCLPFLYLLGELIGSPISRRDKILSGVFFIAIGWASFAYFIVVLGLLKILYLAPVLVLMAIVLFYRREKLSHFQKWLKAITSFFDLRSGVGSWEWFLRAGFFLSIVLTFIFCMLPESSNDGLAYQLNLSKLILKQHSIAPIEYEVRSYTPFLQNVLYTIGLMFTNAPMAKLFNWVTGVLLVLGVAAVVQEKTKQKGLAVLTGALLWLTPTLLNQITTAYVDAGVTLFVFLSLFLLVEEYQKRSSIFYSGILLGIAVSIKLMTAAICVPAALAYSVWQVLKGRFAKTECLQVMIWGTGLLIGCGFWFIRDWILTGSPVFPQLVPAWDKEFYFFALQGLPRTPLNYLLIFWNLTFIPIEFDPHHWVGPAYLILLPVVIYGAFKEKKILPYVFLMWAMLSAWFWKAQLSRYLMPMFPFYLICAAIVIHLLRKRLSSLIKMIQCALFIFLFALSIYHFRIQFLPILRIWSADQYLEFTERTTGIAKWVNANLSPDAKILMHGEVRYFYFDRDVVFDEYFSIFENVQTNIKPKELANLLKSKGFTHILISARTEGQPTQPQNEYDFLAENSSLARKLNTTISQNGREDKYVYNVYELL